MKKKKKKKKKAKLKLIVEDALMTLYKQQQSSQVTSPTQQKSWNLLVLPLTVGGVVMQPIFEERIRWF
jgi:hypothetical protein